MSEANEGKRRLRGARGEIDMDINPKHAKKVKEIMSKIQCSEDFKCANSGFNELCKARDDGIEGCLECLEENPSKCVFAVSFGFGYLCRCPLRCYVAKVMKK